MTTHQQIIQLSNILYKYNKNDIIKNMLIELFIKVISIKYKIISDILENSSEEEINKNELINFIYNKKYNMNFIVDINKMYNQSLNIRDYDDLYLTDIEYFNFDSIIRKHSTNIEIINKYDINATIGKSGFKDKDRIGLTSSTVDDVKIKKQMKYMDPRHNNNYIQNVSTLENVSKFIKFNINECKKFIENCTHHSISLSNKFVYYIIKMIDRSITFNELNVYLLKNNTNALSDECFKLNKKYSNYYSNFFSQNNHEFIKKYFNNYLEDCKDHYDISKLLSKFNEKTQLNDSIKYSIHKLFDENYGYNKEKSALVKEIKEILKHYNIKMDINIEKMKR